MPYVSALAGAGAAACDAELEDGDLFQLADCIGRHEIVGEVRIGRVHSRAAMDAAGITACSHCRVQDVSDEFAGGCAANVDPYTVSSELLSHASVLHVGVRPGVGAMKKALRAMPVLAVGVEWEDSMRLHVWRGGPGGVFCEFMLAVRGATHI